MEKAGFGHAEGSATYIDLVKECCEQKVEDTLANNPWPNAYLTIALPTPADVTYTLPAAWLWQLRADEAVVMVGQTPPPAAYFSYQTFAAFVPPNPNRLGIAVGDTINISTVHTAGPDHFNQPIVYILTGNQTTEQRVRAAVLAAEYPEEIINVETIAPALTPMGFGVTGSVFYLAHRTAVPVNQADLEAYIKAPPYRVFRVTPNEPVASAPEPVPVLRVQGTGHTEMDLYPALKRLRQAIVTRYAGLQKTELDTRVWEITDLRVLLENPYVGLQRGLFLMGATRDTNYLSTYPNFKLRDDSGEFLIVYGVNHHKTGKATYASISVYADARRWFGVATEFDKDFGDSARQYLGPADPDADLLYAIKVARDCTGEPYCLEVTAPEFKDINGQPYTCTPPLVMNEADMFLLFRAYMEPATKVGPDANELVYDRAIKFSPSTTFLPTVTR